MEVRVLDSSLEKFIKTLEKSTIAKTLRTIDLLEKFGPNLGLSHSKKISGQLHELRIRGVREVRIFYTFRKSRIFLLHGFIKKSQRIPKKEIRVALEKARRLDSV